jgi:DNA sulfur modification protein DndC
LTAQPTLFDGARQTLRDAVQLTVDSLRAYGERHDHWAIAYSGGKDSSTVVTLVPALIRLGLVPAPKRLTVCYADTRMELPPLAGAAKLVLERLAADGIETRVAVAGMDKRYFVYMLGRGVPPPNNSTFRWCTRQIKVDPMHAALRELAGEAGGKILMLTGVRVGESAARDARIAVSCGRNGAECGQGWYQETLPGDTCDTLAPILHWRACMVWDWLMLGACDREVTHDYPTGLVAEAYGQGEDGSDVELNARTGCVGCPLATVDTALDGLLRRPKWAYLSPLKALRPLYRWLRQPAQRLRKPGFETGAGGVIRHTNRLGPLTFEARLDALGEVLAIQGACNAARPEGLPVVDLLDDAEVGRIRELIAAGTWPQRWSGDEPTGDVPFERVSLAGEIQRSFLSEGGAL